MMLDDALALLPGLRRLRSLEADMLRILLDRRRGECTWCGDAIPQGRRGWCGEACVTAFQSRCSPNHYRVMIQNRDHGVCQLCGRDTDAAEVSWAKQPTSAWMRRSNETRAEQDARGIALAVQLRAVGYARGRWREVDHIVPVSRRGGLCGLEGLRLLCGVCHDDETTKLKRGER